MADPIKSVQVQVYLPRMDLPVVDPKTGMVNQEWYTFFETLRDRTGGDEDAVDGASTTAAEAGQAAENANQGVEEVKAFEVQAGRGLEGGGPIDGGVTLSVKYDGGWVWSTGALDKTTPYASYVPVVGAVTYDPNQVTALSSALADLSKRYVALEQAMRNTEALDE